MKKLLIFGGTFDPIHIGHARMLNAAINKVKPDLTLVIPNKIPPLKDGVPTASIPDRLAMLKIALKKFKNTRICDYEINSKSKTKSYTYLTIKYLKQKYLNYEFYFLMGMDRLNDFKQWKNWEMILKNVTLVVVGRNNAGANLDNIIKLSINEINTSSKQLRTNPDKRYLDLGVIKYIADNGVYAVEQIKPLMSDYRFQHTLRVAQTAIKICSVNYKKLIKKAYIASMYHDVAKEFNRDEILELIHNQYNPKRFPTAHTLHGCASAAYIKAYFYITDKEILQAIYDHVIPPKNPSTLSKILYCADKLEPARTKKDTPNRKELLELAITNLDEAYQRVLAYNISRFK